MEKRHLENYLIGLLRKKELYMNQVEELDNQIQELTKKYVNEYYPNGKVVEEYGTRYVIDDDHLRFVTFYSRCLDTICVLLYGIRCSKKGVPYKSKKREVISTDSLK